MKNKKIIIATAVVGAVVLLGVGLIFKDGNVDNKSPLIIQEGKKLAKGKDVEEYVDNAFKMYQKHGPISTQIWEGYDLQDKSIIVGEKDNKTDEVIRAWRLTTTDKRALTKAEIKEIEFPNVGGYNKINFENKEGVSLALNQNILSALSFMDFNYLYEVSVHEMYHFYFDDMKKYDEITNGEESNTERYTKFPKEAKPRVYRKMIYDNIIAAYENPSEQDLYLGRAKYWNEKWQNEYPEEYNQSQIVDIAEGKARYVEYLMCITHEDISREEKIEAIKSIFHKESEMAESISDESYKLGFVSGVLLDQMSPNWKKEITDTPQRPVEMLFKNVDVVIDDSDNLEKSLVKANAQMKKSNKKIQKQIKNIEEAEVNTNIPLLVVNNSFMEGSFTTNDFIEYNGKVVAINLGATFKNNNSSVKIDNISTYISEEKESIYTIPLIMEYKCENDRLIINKKGISVDTKVKEVKNSEGRIVYVMV